MAFRGLRIGVIGGGKMGQALIKGLIARGCSRKAVIVSDTSPAIRRRITRQLGVPVSDDNLRVASSSDVVILAVKPQQIPNVIEPLAAYLTARKLVISIAAGITLKWLQARLAGVPVIRSMPNLPATVAEAFSAIAAGRRANRRHIAIAQQIFGAVGEVVELPERYFDAVTAVSGSGPGYVFFLVDAWEKAAGKLGLPRSVAVRAIQQTLSGSSYLLRTSKEDAAALVKKVASKRGTTEAALKVLSRYRVAAHFTQALRASARRSRSLSWS